MFKKVFEPKLQKELADLGFSYTIETDGDKQIYVFADTKELQEYLSEKYSDEQWYYVTTNRLCF